MENDSDKSEVSTEEIRKILDTLLSKMGSGHVRRNPVRLEAISNAFKDREDGIVTIEEIAELLWSDEKDFTKRRKYAASAISWLNKLLDEYEIVIESRRTTIYRFRYKK